MSSDTLLLVIIGAWIAIGLAVPFVMARRGHDAFAWLVVGMVLGPLAIVLAFDSARYAETLESVVVEKGEANTGLAILVGYDGSTHAQHALARLEDLGGRIGRLTIARVVPFAPPREDLALAERDLEHARQLVPPTLGVAPTFEVIEGQPAAAMAELARREGYDLVVIGRRGAGLTKTLLGSTAQRLAHLSDVSVMIVSDPASSHQRTEQLVQEPSTTSAL
jgi:nucleotide-binding universal stress UspA family protein